MSRHYGLVAAWMLALAIFFFWLSGDYSNCNYALQKYDKSFSIISKELKACKERNDVYPTNDEGFGPIISYRKASKAFDLSVGRTLALTSSEERRSWELNSGLRYPCVTVDTRLFTLIDRFDVPLTYENRRGLAVRDFEFSPLKDSQEVSWFGRFVDENEPKWWHEVDKGVFIYSLGSKRMYENNKVGQLFECLGCLFLLLVPPILVLRYFANKREAKEVKRPIVDKVAAFFKWLLVGIAVIFYGSSAMVMCYFGGPPRKGDTSGLREEHDELLASFVSRGLIKAETAEKLKKVTRYHDVRRW